MKKLLILSLCLPLTIGCFHKLDQDMLDLVQIQNSITFKVAEFERNQMAIVDGIILQYFDLAEAAIIKAENARFLDERTGMGDDGVERLYATNAEGQTVAISRQDVQRYAEGLATAKSKLEAKRREWSLLKVQWEAVIDQLEISSQLTVTNMQDITEAKKSAQKVLDDIVSVIAQIARVAAGFLLVA